MGRPMGRASCLIEFSPLCLLRRRRLLLLFPALFFSSLSSYFLFSLFSSSARVQWRLQPTTRLPVAVYVAYFSLPTIYYPWRGGASSWTLRRSRGLLDLYSIYTFILYTYSALLFSFYKDSIYVERKKKD